MKRGRPSRPTQVTMLAELRKYFGYGITAIAVAQKTGINIKTVSKYFEEWSKEILENESLDFLEQQKKQRARAIASFDLLIIEMHELLEQINAEIQKQSSQNKNLTHVYGTKLAIAKFISELVEKKTSFATMPVMDEKLRVQISEMIQNEQNRNSVQ